MWQKLASLERDNAPNVTKFPNNKSSFIIQVQDKIFKLKKNPAYTGPLNLPDLPDLHPDPEAEPDDAIPTEEQAAVLDDDTAYSKPPEESVVTAAPSLPPPSRETQPTPASITNTTWK